MSVELISRERSKCRGDFGEENSASGINVIGRDDRAMTLQGHGGRKTQKIVHQKQRRGLTRTKSTATPCKCSKMKADSGGRMWFEKNDLVFPSSYSYVLP